MKLRVVIFDDDPMIRDMLWTVSAERGYEVLTFPDPGVCPLHTLAHCQCPSGTICADMVISDVNMLSVSGLDFVEDLLHKNCRAPHFALMSGGWTESDLARAARLECTLFTKPFRYSEIIAWFEKVEDRISLERVLIDWSIPQQGRG